MGPATQPKPVPGSHVTPFLEADTDTLESPILYCFMNFRYILYLLIPTLSSFYFVKIKTTGELSDEWGGCVAQLERSLKGNITWKKLICDCAACKIVILAYKSVCLRITSPVTGDVIDKTKKNRQDVD